MRIKKMKSRQIQKGSSLLEVLIAILIMSFGLLGLAGMTVASLRYAKMAQFQTIGTQLAASYGDSIRGNVTGFIAGNYNQLTPYTGASSGIAIPVCKVPSKCTIAEIASIDSAEWNNNLRRRLPGGGAYVVRDANNTLAADIWVIWADPSLDFGGSNLSVATSGGNQCPTAALVGMSSNIAIPRCMYFRVSL